MQNRAPSGFSDLQLGQSMPIRFSRSGSFRFSGFYVEQNTTNMTFGKLIRHMAPYCWWNGKTAFAPKARSS